MLIAYILVIPRVEWRRVRPVAALLGLAVLLVVLQLVPMPPSLWMSLPGRDLFVEAAAVIDRPQPWRPVSLSPGATANALASLIVPAFALLMMANVSRQNYWRLLTVLLVLIFAGCCLGLLQFSGARYDNPLTNDILGVVSGPFANRNHFALFVGIGCLLVPAWAFHEDNTLRWKAIAATGLMVLLIMMTLAIGSRMGIVVSVLGTGIGVVTVQGAIRRALQGMNKKLAISVALGVVALVALAVTLSVTLDRAEALNRMMATEATADSRAQFLPIAVGLVDDYFPVGSGFGAFDPVFRIGEPDRLLDPSYVNHAHNDWVEIVLDGGILAVLLAAAAILWWLLATWRAWRGEPARTTFARLGSGIVLLVMVASVSDYPARTPMIMALLIIGAVWLNEGSLVEKTRQSER